MDGMRKSVTIGDFFSNDHYGCTTIMNKAVKKNLVKKFIKLILISSWFKYTLSCFMLQPECHQIQRSPCFPKPDIWVSEATMKPAY